MNKLGESGEKRAAKYLRQHHYSIVETNYSSRFGEIDIIAKNKKYIVFAEVKQRSESAIALPREFVDLNKQKRLITTAEIYLSSHPTQLQPRFDVIEIYTENNKIKSLKHLENAFTLV
ncbi:MAG: YraN family protein [Eubacterium sp.]